MFVPSGSYPFCRDCNEQDDRAPTRSVPASDSARLDYLPNFGGCFLQCNVLQHCEEEIMRIRFVAKDPDSVPDQSPTLYKTDRDSWLVQGWAVTDPAALAEMNIPNGETVVEIPDRLIPFFQEG
jgi:hypothetical protein